MRAIVHAVLALAIPFSAFAGDKDFLNAREAAHKHQSSRFEKSAKRVREPLLDPYLDFWRIQLAPPARRDALNQDFLRKHEGTHLAERVHAGLAREAGKREDWESVRKWLTGVPAPETDLQCLMLHAGVVENRAEARASAVSLWFTGRDLPESCSPLFNRLIADGSLTEEDLWTRLALALEARQAGVARSVASRLAIEHAPPPDQIGIALASPDTLLARADVSTRGSRLLLVAALARVASFDLERAYTAWQGLQAAYPDVERGRGWAALGAAAGRAHDARALGWFALAMDAASDEQLAWRVRAALRAQVWTDVARAIDTMSARARGEPVWRYWRARAWKALGGRLAATQMFSALARERNYYGQLAEDELGVVLAAPARPSTMTDAQVREVGKRPSIARALKLLALGLREDAANEWRHGIRELDDAGLLAAAELARREGWHERAIVTAEQVRELDAIELRFLAPYRDLASEYVRQYGLDEAWVYGLMRQESRFQNHARSGVGASGLMQIMPATGRWIAQRLGMRRFDTGSLFDLDTNLRFGAYYLKYTLDKLGHPVLATAAYNAGPRRALNWQAGVPMEGAIYVESIPFLETREYVKKVMYNAIHYAQRFGQSRGGLRDRLGMVPARPGESVEIDARSPYLPGDESAATQGAGAPS